MEDIAEEDLWISEKIQQLTVPVNPVGPHVDDDYSGIDKTSTPASSNGYLPKPNVIETEMQAHKALQFEKLNNEAQRLIGAQNFGSDQIATRMNYLESRWADLADLVRQKQQKLADLQETKQFFLDAEDVDSYLYELSRMLTQSAQDDHYVGKDEINVVNLLKKHKDLEDEFVNYRQQIVSVHDQAANLPILKRLEQKDETHGLEPLEKRKLDLLFEQVQSRLNTLDRR